MTLAEFAAPTRWLPLRFALRELRAGARGFYVFIACIALGVMAIAGVGSVAASLADGIAREGRVILGGRPVVQSQSSRSDGARAVVSGCVRSRIRRRHAAGAA